MTWMGRAARLAQVSMGAVLLVAGLVKIWEPVLFYWQIVPYTQLLGITEHWRWFSEAGLLVAPLECVLGAALLSNWRARLIMPVVTVLMLFFVALMVLAWSVGATAECGCFGLLLRRGPGQAAVEDGSMLALLLFAWWGTRGRPGWIRGGRLVAGVAVLALAVGLGRFMPERERIMHSDLLPGVRLVGLRVEGLPVDLQRGRHLVELFSPRCGNCLHAVSRLNTFVKESGVPPLVALTPFPKEGEDVRRFVARSHPQYPIGTITRTDFFRLTWGHVYPRLAYIRDGVVIRVWEHDQLPTAEQVRMQLSSD